MQKNLVFILDKDKNVLKKNLLFSQKDLFINNNIIKIDPNIYIVTVGLIV